jgi:release factor glutamine methyltransferase
MARVTHDVDAVATRLGAAGCLAPEAEAAVLLADRPDAALLDARLRRREDGEPLAWIVGWTEFAGRRVRVTSGVYVPRPQTELLAARALEALPPRGRAVDLCTGSGAIAAHLRAHRRHATVVGVDVDALAVACARRNGVPAVRADLVTPFPAHAFDVTTAVAPYVPTGALRHLPSDVLRHEPRVALDGGDDGLAVVRVVATEARRLLRARGRLLVEVGGDQDEVVVPLLADLGFERIEPWADEVGDLRGVSAALVR